MLQMLVTAKLLQKVGTELKGSRWSGKEKKLNSKQAAMCLGGHLKLQFAGDKFTTLAETDRGQMRSRSSTFQEGCGNVSIAVIKPDRLVTKGFKGSKV